MTTDVAGEEPGLLLPVKWALCEAGCNMLLYNIVQVGILTPLPTPTMLDSFTVPSHNPAMLDSFTVLLHSPNGRQFACH